MSSSTAPETSEPVRTKSKRMDKNMRGPLFAVLEKFSVAEQVEIRRNYHLLPQLLMDAWRETYVCLDLQEFQKQVMGDALLQFLRNMWRYFTSVRFKCDQLQEQLSLLEQSGISSLPAVRECIIMGDSTKTDCCATWPLQSLPKLLSHLCRLELHIPVESGFLEQFGHLKSLILHESVTAGALAGVWCSCEKLKRLQILGNPAPNISGISKCINLEDLTLPVASITPNIVKEIAQLSQLKFLELQQKDATAKVTLATITQVLLSRASDIKVLQINGSRLGNVNFLLQLPLHRCRRLDGLMLIDCEFGAMNMTTPRSLPMLSSLAFCHCRNLSDKQVMNFVTVTPVLTQLYLVGCTKLTNKLLFKLFNKRCIDNLGNPAFELYLPKGEPLHQEFKQNFGKQTALELLETPLENSHIQHVQFIFLPAKSKQ